ncbi:MAG: hypothetical protein M3137_17425 [Actinomycetota bacterium]|nr:hypothetical protein [Actinomycetota bacterium]
MLTPEARHARHVLDVAARGPESTLAIVPALMRSLLEHGHQTSVTWFLAPSPDDDVDEVIISARRSGHDGPGDHRSLGSQDVAGVLDDATDGTGQVEVWSENGHGLRRLVIVGVAGEQPRFVLPDLWHYAGDEPLASAAVAAWRNLSPVGSIPETETSLAEVTMRASSAASAPPDLSNTDGLVTALQEALGQVRVEVDLGAVEELVADSLRSALAELPATAFSPEPERLEADGHPIDRAPMSESPMFGPLPAGLEDLLGGWMTSALNVNLARQLPDLVERLAASTPPQETERTITEADPVDIARRVAASVLSPSEIAETLLFRLRPLLDEHHGRAMHRQSTEAERDRVALEQTRASLNRLAERMDRRLDRLEGEVRRRTPEPDAAEPAPRGEPGSAAGTLRVLRSDDRQ